MNDVLTEGFNPEKNGASKWGYFLLVAIIAVVVTIYYFYTRPYEITTENLTITAAFPGQPTNKLGSFTITKDFSTQIITYQYQQAGVTFLVSITNISSFFLQKNGVQKVMDSYFKAIASSNGYQGTAREIKMDDLLGQSINMQSNSGVMQGKFFLTSGGIVAIFVKLKGRVMTQEGIWFIDSLTIDEHQSSL